MLSIHRDYRATLSHVQGEVDKQEVNFRNASTAATPAEKFELYMGVVQALSVLNPLYDRRISGLSAKALANAAIWKPADSSSIPLVDEALAQARKTTSLLGQKRRARTQLVRAERLARNSRTPVEVQENLAEVARVSRNVLGEPQAPRGQMVGRQLFL